ncbi:MAG: hypothetical protein COA32_17345 [Fluviicola sp.]|nr:MAG: hypothetical protein COA32_17345 [Fluviicola sp.]
MTILYAFIGLIVIFLIVRNFIHLESSRREFALENIDIEDSLVFENVKIKIYEPNTIIAFPLKATLYSFKNYFVILFHKKHSNAHPQVWYMGELPQKYDTVKIGRGSIKRLKVAKSGNNIKIKGYLKSVKIPILFIFIGNIRMNIEFDSKEEINLFFERFDK